MLKRVAPLAVGLALAPLALSGLASGEGTTTGRATDGTRVIHHFTDKARQATISSRNGFPFPGGKVVGIARYTATNEETGKRINGMWIRRVTITEQVAPTEFIGEVTGRNWNRYGTMRVTGELTLRLVPGGGATIQGRAQLLPGTGLYRHVKGRAGFHGIIADPNKPFNEDVKGWISYDKADGLSGP